MHNDETRNAIDRGWQVAMRWSNSLHGHRFVCPGGAFMCAMQYVSSKAREFVCHCDCTNRTEWNRQRVTSKSFIKTPYRGLRSPIEMLQAVFGVADLTYSNVLDFTIRACTTTAETVSVHAHLPQY